MVGGDEHNDIESGTGGVGYDNWAGPQELRIHGGGVTRCRR